MAQRSSANKRDTSIRVEEQVKPSQKKVSVKLSRKILRLRYPTRYVYNSKVTGERVEWAGAGATASVHPDDVTILLAKVKKNTSCCGGTPNRDDYLLFEEV